MGSHVFFFLPLTTRAMRRRPKDVSTCTSVAERPSHHGSMIPSTDQESYAERHYSSRRMRMTRRVALQEVSSIEGFSLEVLLVVVRQRTGKFFFLSSSV